MSDLARPGGAALDADVFVDAMRRRVPAYAPEWEPAPGGLGDASIRIQARFLEVLSSAVVQAPRKNQLAFYDRLGIELLPAHAARAPLAFAPVLEAGHSRVPAGTRVGASVPGRPEPIVFETEADIGMAASRIVQVASLWPGRDAWADHGAALLRGEPFTLFAGLQPIEHAWYLSHDAILATRGRPTLTLRVDLARPGKTAIGLRWEYWDGKSWVPFRAFDEPSGTKSFDGTAGLTKDGEIELVGECVDNRLTVVDGSEGYWIRAVTTSPLPSTDPEDYARVRRVTLAVELDRPVDCKDPSKGAGFPPDAAYANDQRLDVTKTIKPFGDRPQIGSAFYLRADELLGRVGGRATLCFARVESPEEKADREANALETQMNQAAGKVVAVAKEIADAIERASEAVDQGIRDRIWPIPLIDDFADAQLDADFKAKKQAFHAAVQAATSTNLDTLVTLFHKGEELRDFIDTRIFPFSPASAANFPEDFPTVDLNALPTTVKGLVDSFGPAQSQNLSRFWNFQLGIEDGLGILGLLTVVGAIPAFLLAEISLARTIDRLDITGCGLQDAITAATNALDKLNKITPVDAGLAAAPPHQMNAPGVEWEYWNGRRWKKLTGLVGTTDFRADGPLSFDVPDDLEASSVNEVDGRWIRARIVSGGYGVVRIVSFKEDTGQIRQIPMVEYRPPHVDDLRLGYTWKLGPEEAELSVAFNDFQYADTSLAAAGREEPFAPIAPVADRTPAIYVGFDAPLPADLVALYLDLEEMEEGSGPALVWEAWDGASWVTVRVEDETVALTLPGRWAVTWPGFPEPVSGLALQASGSRIQLEDRVQAARFATGAAIEFLKDGGETTRVVAVEGDSLTVAPPLEQSYAGVRVAVARLARFGKPLTWLRARLEQDESPPLARVHGAFLNVAWASQIQTFENEILGSSNGEPEQVFFVRNRPVLHDERLEVRELSGARADVEAPMLRDRLARLGVPEDDVRTVLDPRNGKIREVWVRWRPVAQLGFAAPEERVYAIERSRGRVVFGGRAGGAAPPVSPDGVLLRRYRSGGGAIGNLPRGAIQQLLSGVLAKSVTNVRRAEGGADGESVEAVAVRGRHAVRHRRVAISAEDYEWLAREASSEVAVARALPATHPSGRPAPGWVTVIVIPARDEPRPAPSFGLRRTVRDFLARRAPASARDRIAVLGPNYLAIGVDARLAAADPTRSGVVLEAARAALAAFFHPLTGGPDGNGWRFGRDVHLSDAAARLEAVAGLDYVEWLTLLLDGTPVGDRVPVPVDRVVAAGRLNLSLAPAEA